MTEKEFREAVVSILEEMVGGIEWPPREHAQYKIDKLRDAIDNDKLNTETDK